MGQTVYFKIERSSPDGTKPSSYTSYTVSIPEEPVVDLAPSISSVTSSSNTNGLVSGSVDVSHPSNKVKNLRVHFANNSGFNNSSHVDIGTYTNEQDTGNKSFSFDASSYMGQTVYFKIERSSPDGTKPSSYTSYTVSIPEEPVVDLAPSISSVTSSSNTNGLVSGSVDVSHPSNKVKNLRVHFANNSGFNNSSHVDIGTYTNEQDTGNKSFSFDASSYMGQTVYFKIERSSPDGTKPSSYTSYTVSIPEEPVVDLAPSISSVTSSSNTNGLVSGSVDVSHPSNKVKNLRVHFANNSGFNNSSHVDIGTYTNEQDTGNKSFSFDASSYMGQTVYFKIERSSPDGTKPSSYTSYTVSIPEEPVVDLAPSISSVTSSSNTNGLVSGSVDVSHPSNKVKNLRVHFANNSGFNNSSHVDIGTYTNEQDTGNKSFSFDASSYMGQTVYFKIERSSPDGTKPSSYTSYTVSIPEEPVVDLAPSISSVTSSSNTNGLVSGSVDVSHPSNKVKNLRVHFANNSGFNNSSHVDIGTYTNEQDTGNKSFSFDASFLYGTNCIF